MKALVSEKGQVTIPKRLRDRLGILPGQVLTFSEERGTLIVKKEGIKGPRAAYGLLKLGKPTDELMRALRGKRAK